MSYAVDNAVFQWEEGERRVREQGTRSSLDRAAAAVLDGLRRRLGSSFTLQELADVYAAEEEWAGAAARRYEQGTDAAFAVDAAFARYGREAKDYSGSFRR